MRDLRGHRSAEEISEHLDAQGERLPRASVYDSPEALRDSGLVMMADVGPGRAVYEAADACHHHFVCGHRGVVVDVACVRGRKPCLEAELPGAAIDEAQVVFRGVCATRAAAR